MRTTPYFAAFMAAATLPLAVAAQDNQPAPSMAATSNPSTSSDAQAGQTSADQSMDEVIVTAQKRAQNVNSVGMSITALSGDQLKLQNIDSVEDIAKIDSSFVVAQTNFGAPYYSIRGVGYNDFSLAATPDVSVYTDEIPYAYPIMTKGAPFDLERVEVLKGPQGTLYGQNATGGAVNYIAAKPTDSLDAEIASTYGRFNAVNLEGHVSGPITDKLSARLAFDVDEGGGMAAKLHKR